jgi:hypothetical protein
MRAIRFSKMAVPVISVATIALLSACGSTSESSGSNTEPADSVESVESADTGEAEAVTGAMADASFAVTVFLDTMWPIEGNEYADAATVEGWCATFATDPDAAVAAVAEYLNSESEIAAADPASVTTSVAEYLDGNCYLLEE